jgi:hypothetical protein
MRALRPWTAVVRAVRRLRAMLPFGAGPVPPSAAAAETDDEAEDRLAPDAVDEGAGGGPWGTMPTHRQRPADIGLWRHGRDAPAYEARAPVAETARAVPGPSSWPPADRGGLAPSAERPDLPPPSGDRADVPPPPPQPVEPLRVDPREAHIRRLEQILDRARRHRRWIALDAPGAFRNQLEGVIREADAFLDGEAILAFQASGGIAIPRLRIAALVRTVGLAEAVEFSRELGAAQILRNADVPRAAQILARLAELELLART